LYEAALLETDADKLRERITTARIAILERIESRIRYPGNTVSWMKLSATCENWRKWQCQNVLPEKLLKVASESAIQNLASDTTSHDAG
jgi:hypothetical protein